MDRTIYLLGETTYDIIFKDEKPVDAKVGGSQLNTAVSLGRLGLPVKFISQTGNDRVGDISRKFLSENGICSDHISLHEGNSRVALAYLDKNNNADYTFFKPVTKNLDMNLPRLKENDIVLFGSSYAVREDIRPILVNFLKDAKEAGAIVVYDPNFRKSNLNNIDKFKPLMMENFELADIIKGSDEDFYNLLKVQNSTGAYKILSAEKKLNMLYTAGKSGVFLHTPGITKTYKVPKIIPVSTIGAGDNFNAGIIFSLYKMGVNYSGINQISEEQWNELVFNAINFAQNVCMGYDNYVSVGFAQQFRN